jgi:hypothetical protein
MQRISPEEIRAHPWITGDYKKVGSNLNVLNKMREWNTKRKINLDQ